MATSETATLGGGCFWCLEAVYDEMQGVVSVESGYMGGHVPNPDYHTVCTGRSGHVEVVQVTFDPAIASYRDILEVFFAVHDPTSLDRQGNDSGPQYRSVIFYHDDGQRAVAEEIIRELNAESGARTIVIQGSLGGPPPVQGVGGAGPRHSRAPGLSRGSENESGRLA